MSKKDNINKKHYKKADLIIKVLSDMGYLDLEDTSIEDDLMIREIIALNIQGHRGKSKAEKTITLAELDKLF